MMRRRIGQRIGKREKKRRNWIRRVKKKIKDSKTISYNLLMHNTNDFELCLKDSFKDEEYHKVDLKKHTGFKEGRIYIASTEENTVEWLDILNRYTRDFLDDNLYKNKSNKAVLMLKLNDRIFSVVFGYGRTMLDDTSVVKNFGLRTAINLIEESNIKSLNSLNISSEYLDIQRQSIGYGSHSDLQVNTNSDILKSISGRASSDSNFSAVNGADNLRFSAKSDVSLAELLQEILDAYRSSSYKKKGLEWIDHIQSVKDRSIIKELDNKLLEHITNSSLESPRISPNKIISHIDIEGYMISGMSVSSQNRDNYYDDIPEQQFWDYLNEISNATIDKLKRSSLYYWSNSKSHKISNVYNCLFLETEYNNKRYFINNGDWFEIEPDYYTRITEKINRIERLYDDKIPSCKIEWSEGDFNEEFAKSNPNRFKLFDKQNFHLPAYGHSKIEPADIITINKQFIHVKKGGSSANLSHLFAQGVVSAQLYKNEKEFIDEINKEFREGYFKPNDEIEVIYGVIDKRFEEDASKILPFFSMVNLSQHYDVLSSMGIKCRLLFIGYEVLKYSTDEKNILRLIKNELKNGQEKTANDLFGALKSNLDIKTVDTFKKKYLSKYIENNDLKTDSAKRSQKYYI